jgi:hypothetical protein
MIVIAMLAVAVGRPAYGQITEWAPDAETLFGPKVTKGTWQGRYNDAEFALVEKNPSDSAHPLAASLACGGGLPVQHDAGWQCEGKSGAEVTVPQAVRAHVNWRLFDQRTWLMGSEGWMYTKVLVDCEMRSWGYLARHWFDTKGDSHGRSISVEQVERDPNFLTYAPDDPDVMYACGPAGGR